MVWGVDIGPPSRQGRLMALNPFTGDAYLDTAMVGRGQRYTLPLIVDDRIYLSSCPGDRAPGFLEGFELR